MVRISRYLFLLLAVSGCAAAYKVTEKELSEAMALKGDVTSGRSVYEKNCIFCHRERGEGGGTASGTLERSTAKRDEDLYRAVKEGAGGWMPPYPGMTPKETVDVITYIRSLFPGK